MTVNEMTFLQKDVTYGQRQCDCQPHNLNVNWRRASVVQKCLERRECLGSRHDFLQLEFLDRRGVIHQSRVHEQVSTFTDVKEAFLRTLYRIADRRWIDPLIIHATPKQTKFMIHLFLLEITFGRLVSRFDHDPEKNNSCPVSFPPTLNITFQLHLDSLQMKNPKGKKDPLKRRWQHVPYSNSEAIKFVVLG